MHPTQDVRVPVPAIKTSRLARMLVNGRRHEVRTVAPFGKIRVELIGEKLSHEIEADMYREMDRLKIPLTSFTAERYEAVKARLTLAEAIRDPETNEAWGTRDEWAALDIDLINVAWHEYADVRRRLDPVAWELPEDEKILITAAVKKKDDQLLRAFGTVKLSLWLASMGDLLSISPTPSSSNSDSPSELVASDSETASTPTTA